jgi:hypothetical protein
MHRPEVEVPRAMGAAILLGLFSAFIFLSCFLACVTDINAVSDPSRYWTDH